MNSDRAAGNCAGTDDRLTVDDTIVTRARPCLLDGLPKNASVLGMATEIDAMSPDALCDTTLDLIAEPTLWAMATVRLQLSVRVLVARYRQAVSR